MFHGYCKRFIEEGYDIDTKINYHANYGEELVMTGLVTSKKSGKSARFNERMKWSKGDVWKSSLSLPPLGEAGDVLCVEYGFSVQSGQQKVRSESPKKVRKLTISGNSPRHMKFTDFWADD